MLDAQFAVVLVNRGRKYWGTRDHSNGRVVRVEADRRKTDVFSQRLSHVTKLVAKGGWDLVADFCGFDTPDAEAALQGLSGRFRLYAFISSDSVYEVCALPAQPQNQPHPFELVEEMSVRPASIDERKRLRKRDDYGDGKLNCEETFQRWVDEEMKKAPQTPPPCIIACWI